MLICNALLAASLTGLVPLDLALLDAPYNTAESSKNWPSMQQATRLSASAYQLLHYGAGKVLEPYEERGFRRMLNILGFVVLDSVITYVPPFEAWSHEEYHRAVMGYRGISSYDDVNDLPFGAEVIAVSHVKDDDLVRLKRDHPADMVRLAAAGAEGQNQLTLALEKDSFFDDAPQYHDVVYWMGYAQNYFYVASGSDGSADEMADEMNAKEDEIPVRDFVGHDFTSWVYDLHRPDEPYEARGVHPSGNGLNRYRRYSDLTAGEKSYLRLQGRMYLLNFLDPHLVGVSAFPGAGFDWNGSLRHDLTAFGAASSANLFYKKGPLNLFGTLYHYKNAEVGSFGVDLQLLKWALGGGYLASARAMAWQQPKDLLYRSGDLQAGGLASMRLDVPLGPKELWLYGEVEGKTEGWVAGAQNLDRSASVRTGVFARVF